MGADVLLPNPDKLLVVILVVVLLLHYITLNAYPDIVATTHAKFISDDNTQVLEGIQGLRGCQHLVCLMSASLISLLEIQMAHRLVYFLQDFLLWMFLHV